jgi:hypothetical protein
MAGWTRLELATFCVTGRRSNQLSYHPVIDGTGTFSERNRRVKPVRFSLRFVRIRGRPWPAITVAPARTADRCLTDASA